MATAETRRQGSNAETLIAEAAARRGSDGKTADRSNGAASEEKGEAARLRIDVQNEKLRADRADQRYLVLQGKYNAEVPRLTQERNTLKEQLAAANARSGGGGGGTAVSEDVKLPNEAELVGLYGEAMVKTIKSIASSIADAKVQGLKPPAEEKKPAERTQNQEDDVPNAELIARYEGMLDTMVPKWREQNDDPKFIAWLQQRDPMAGVTRMTVLTRHHRAMDAQKVAEVFKAFTDNREIGSASSSSQSIDPPLGEGDAGTQGADKKTFTRAEISQFYKDCSLGVYAKRGKAGLADKARIEQEIFAAQRDGRVK